MTTNSEFIAGMTDYTTELPSDSNATISHAHNDGNQTQTDVRSSLTTNTTTTAAATAKMNQIDLLRTETRNSCGIANGKDIARSWYARCSRWRSLSCERRKNRSLRYSWNMVANQM